MGKNIEFKRGDTFTLSCLYKVDGSPSSVDSIDIQCQLRTSTGSLVHDFVVTKDVAIGSFVISASALTTSSWPVTVLRCDIQFTEVDNVRSTQTFFVKVDEEITT